MDRNEILTTKPSLKDSDKLDLALFGYLRGGDLQSSKGIYITGLGFVQIEDIKKASDPCPLVKYEERDKTKWSLRKREKIIFAP